MNVDFVFVSDLHLSATPAAESAQYTAGFARFVEHLRDRSAAEGRSCRLVLLGDALDFMNRWPPAPARERHRNTSTESTVSTLDEIARKEPLFFSALGRFATAGFFVDVIPGNHDIDLVRPRAQERLRQLVERSSGTSGTGQRISFHPWIYHVPGIVYAEHGHQYHDINSFATVLRPYSPGDEDRLDLPLAAHLEGSDGSSPFGWVWHKGRVATSLLRQALELSDPQRAHRRVRYREDVLRPYAAEVGLDQATLVAIDQVSDVSAASIAGRLLRKAFAAGRGSGLPTQQGGYLHEAALAIHRILTLAHASVPYYVFGHTHIAEQWPLVPGASSPEYLNTGTWSPRLPRGVSRQRGGSPLLSFIQIRANSGAEPRAEAFVWDDPSHRARPLATFQGASAIP